MTSSNLLPSASVRPRILCVDDEPHVVAALRDALRREFDVSTATSGPEALQVLADASPFTVVVSDFAMPGMDGSEFLAQARVIAPDAIRILLTGHATVHSAIDAVNNGFIFRFLTKPCSHRQLQQAIEDAVEQHRLITADRVLLERKVEAMSEHLLRAERLASLGTMAGAVGHELNNALSVLAGTIDLIRADAAQGKAVDSGDLAELQRARESLLTHATNLRYLGRPPHEDETSFADLGDAVKGIVELLQRAGVLRNVRLQLTGAESGTVVRMKQPEIEQILINLIKNAVDALADTNRTERLIRVEITHRPEETMARCSVTDNADGIPCAVLPLIFEPYYTTKPPDRGTGLGLFVVRQLTQASGGGVSVRSVEGRGTTFEVYLPLADEDMQAAMVAGTG